LCLLCVLAVAFWHSFTKVFVVEFSTGKNWNLTKVFVPVEVKFYQPSCVGLPVKFSLESVLYLRVNTTVKAEVQPKFFIPLPEQVTVSGKLNIRYDIWHNELLHFFILSNTINTKEAEPLFPYHRFLLRRGLLGKEEVNWEWKGALRTMEREKGGSLISLVSFPCHQI